MELLASSEPIVNYLRCYQGLIHLYSTAAWRYLESRGVRKLEGHSPKNLLNRKLIKKALQRQGSTMGEQSYCSRKVRSAGLDNKDVNNTSGIQLILSPLILDKQAAQYVSDARIVLRSAEKRKTDNEVGPNV